MNLKEYHSNDVIYSKLTNGFQKADWALGGGLELIAHGWEAPPFVRVERLDSFWEMACDWGLQMYIPIVGKNGGDSILLPMDFEISLGGDEGMQLYEGPGTMWDRLSKHVKPNAEILESVMQKYHCPYVMDLTPSGGHLLFQVDRGTNAFDYLASIGSLEDDLVRCYSVEDKSDPKRSFGTSLDSGLVYNGLTRFAIGMGIVTKNNQRSGLAATFSDSKKKCFNFDISWTWSSAFMRIIRAPFTGHKKNIEKYHKAGQPPLVDIMKTSYNGHDALSCDDWGHMVSCMWNMEEAIKHNSNFDGFIPVANDNLIALMDDLLDSELGEFYRSFDKAENWSPGSAIAYARQMPFLSDKTKHVLQIPYPRLLQPHATKMFVRDFMWNLDNEISMGKIAKFVGSVQRDAYLEDHGWPFNWEKEPPLTKGNQMASQFVIEILHELGHFRDL